MVFTKWLRFSEIPESARGRPGLYEIRYGRVMLKIGIAGDLSRRLRQHGDSLQRRLMGPLSNPWTDPKDVVSKASILAKHLYLRPPLTIGSSDRGGRIFGEPRRGRWSR